ncbi:hypothetical protein CH063_03388, partial [Colletotrichum higginsianum]
MHSTQARGIAVLSQTLWNIKTIPVSGPKGQQTPGLHVTDTYPYLVPSPTPMSRTGPLGPLSIYPRFPLPNVSLLPKA